MPLFAACIFGSACLLFLMQPLVGKLLLPLAGGTPAVWNSCMLCFQGMLLAGYAWAHFGSRLLGHRLHLAAHLLLVVVAASVLPVGPNETAAETFGRSLPPIVEIPWLVLQSAGLPFFVLSATSPLLSRWLTLRYPDRDPWPMYAASNAGSLVALLAWPLVVEPLLPLRESAYLHALGFLLVAGLLFACGSLVWNRRPEALASIDTETIPARRKALWVLLAFVPSSLLLSVTTHLSTDIAPIPLLWIVPLGLYLLSLIAAFARRQLLSRERLGRLLPPVVLILMLLLLSGSNDLAGLPVLVLPAIHLGAFYVLARALHGELAHRKPTASHLTEFYLWVAVGGVLGGVFNGLLAPLMFSGVGFAEYPLGLLLALLACPGYRQLMRLEPEPARGFVRRMYPLLPLFATIAGSMVVAALAPDDRILRLAATLGIPLVLAYPLVDSPPRLAASLSLVALMTSLAPVGGDAVVLRERNYFGEVRVVEGKNPQGRYHRLMHGTTIHGQQSLDTTDSEGRHLPLTYYHTSGPIGRLLIEAGKAKPRLRVAAIGLGTGSLAYYARAGEEWSFLEIDPAIVRIARDPAYFAYLQECRAEVTTIAGDARQTIRTIEDGSLDLLILDAFSSDAIPTHLLTAEAFQLYIDKLEPGGLIAVHISNRWLDLAPVLGNVAAAIDPPATAIVMDDRSRGRGDDTGIQGSIWAAMSTRPETWGRLFERRSGWDPLEADRRVRIWTDSYSPIGPLLRSPGD